MKISESGFGDEKIKFPVKYDLKVIIDATIPQEESKIALSNALKEIKVPFKFKTERLSKTSKYISFTISVNIENQEIMKKMYAELNKVSGFKMAI